ncbi:MAG: hypothetical protein FJ349_08600 [Sphingomonadales bacterium]|nr:hypothetical protein [Sphingomonadales bacterium]
MVFRYLLFLLPILSSSCVKNNPDPSWLQVTEWTLEANPDLNGEEGQLTHKLTDAWVYIDDQLIGVFEVPFKIPILKNGFSKIRLYPTIRVNGIAATKMRNEHLEAFEIGAELIQNQTLQINPVTHYKSNLSFWIEDFEDINIKLTDDPNTSSAHLNLANDTLKWFNGNYYGRVLLNAQDSMWIAYTNQDQQLSIPKNKQAMLEIDYCNSVPFTHYLLFVNSNGTNENLMPTMNKSPMNMLRWKKIYILLSEVITAGPNNSNYIQAFKAFHDASISNNLILIDNIKVVYFQ